VIALLRRILLRLYPQDGPSVAFEQQKRHALEREHPWYQVYANAGFRNPNEERLFEEPHDE
jgi:hypothetical protein